MTNEEIVKQIQAGQKELLQVLWGQVERFVWMQAGKWASKAGYSGEDSDLRDDLYQAGFLALCEAVPTYKEDAGRSFIGWLNYYLRNHFISLLYGRVVAEKYDALKKAVSLDEDLIEDEKSYSLHDVVADPAAEEAFEEVTEEAGREGIIKLVHDAINTLPAEEKAFYLAYLKHGLVTTDTCKALNLKYSDGRRHRDKGRRKISKYIKKHRETMEELDWIYNRGLRFVSYQSWRDNQFTSQTEALALRLVDRNY